MTAFLLTRFTAHSHCYSQIMHTITMKIISAIIRRPVSFFLLLLN